MVAAILRMNKLNINLQTYSAIVMSKIILIHENEEKFITKYIVASHVKDLS